MKDEFYLDLHSEASKTSFPNNCPGSFRSKLTEPIELEGGDWDVAIASISQYYETSLEDVHFIREKRSASTTPGVTITKTYPPGNTAKISAAYTEYIASASNPKYWGYHDDEDTTCIVTLTVDSRKKEITYPCNPFIGTAMTAILASETFEGVKFELTEWWNVGVLTASIPKGDPKDIVFEVEFSKELKTLMKLPQSFL